MTRPAILFAALLAASESDAATAPAVPPPPSEASFGTLFFDARFGDWTEAAWRSADATAVNDALNRGADPNARNRHGVPPLAFAVARSGAEAVAALLAAGADPSIRWRGRPMLAIALRNRESGAEIAALLLAAGEDPQAMDPVGETSVLAMAAARHLGVFDAILHSRAGPDGFRPGDAARLNAASYLLKAPVETRARVLGYFAARTADPAGADPQGRTLLHAAARFGVDDAGTLERLAAGGAAVSARDARGRTPLATALAESRWGVALKLLSLGARAAPGDWRPRPRPEHGAAQAAFLRALVEAGVDVAAIRAEDSRPLTTILAEGRADGFGYFRDLVATDPVLAPALIGGASAGAE